MVQAARLTVAAVQFAGTDSPELSRARAEPSIEVAARHGAELVLLPELFTTAYRLDETLWNAGEPFEGPTLHWMRRIARSNDLYLGGTFVETDGADFYNTFTLVGPSGAVYGPVRKRFPAAAEAYFFRAGDTPHVLDTPVGRIGVGICYDALRGAWGRRVVGRVDLLLVPACAPSPTVDRFNTAMDRREFDAFVSGEAAALAARFGVPVVFANHCGRWESSLPWPFQPQSSGFPGHSCISESTGTVVARLGADEGVCIADIVPGARTVSPELGYFTISVPRKFPLFAIPAFVGRLKYGADLCGRRQRRARACFSAGVV